MFAICGNQAYTDPPYCKPKSFSNILCHKAIPSTNVRSSTPVF
jgi:hypothetical protein